LNPDVGRPAVGGPGVVLPFDSVALTMSVAVRGFIAFDPTI